MKTTALTTTVALLLAIPVFGQEKPTPSDSGTLDKAKDDAAFKKRPFSPYADRKFPTRPLFGDQHLPTSFSMDAGAFGCRLAPRDAYRFARGVRRAPAAPASIEKPVCR